MACTICTALQAVLNQPHGVPGMEHVATSQWLLFVALQPMIDSERHDVKYIILPIPGANDHAPAVTVGLLSRRMSCRSAHPAPAKPFQTFTINFADGDDEP